MEQAVEMKITKRQLRRLIREALLIEQRDNKWKPEHAGYHPLFDGSYAGNGYTTDMWEPPRGFFEENPDN